MNNYSTVRIDNDVLLDMLNDRLLFWIKDSESAEFRTFSGYYEQLISEGCFNGIELDINVIVDNDYINNFDYYETLEDAEADYKPGYVEEHIEYECDHGYLIATH